MITKKSNIVFCCLIVVVCLLLNGCKEEDYLLRRGNRDVSAGNYESAIKKYDAALNINPRNAALYYNRGHVWHLMGELDNAVNDYTKALDVNKEYVDAYQSRGMALFKKGNYDLAISDFTKALLLNSDNYSKVGLYFNRAYALFKLGDYERAIDDYTESIRIGGITKITPTDKAEAYYFRAKTWHENANFENAISDYTKAIELNPKYTQAVFDRANTWHEKREYASAIIDYEKVIELDPKNAHAYNNYSWLLSTCPDSRFRNGAKALKLALKAVELNPEEVFFLDTLAAAYAELENFKQAVQIVERAITLLEKDNKENLKETLLPQLESYKAGKPWREDVKREDWMRKYKIKEPQK